jgi:hypothetical protein
MATVDRNTLKQWFVRGAKPTALQFAEWIESFWHKEDNIPANKVEGLQDAFDAKAEKEAMDNLSSALEAHKTDTAAHEDIRQAIAAEADARESADDDEKARAEEVEATLTPKSKLTAILTGAAFSSDATSVTLTLSVYNASLDTSSNAALTVPMVSGTNPGMMSKETYNSLTQALADILALQQQGGKFIGRSFATKAALDAYTFTDADNPGDFTYVIDDESNDDATTRYIISGTKAPADTRAWSFGYVINYDPVGLATTAAAGLVKGAAATAGDAGKVFVESDGTMSVIGWDDVITAVGSLSSLTTTAKGSLVAAINELKTEVDGKASNTPTFSEASLRANIATGESIPTLFGKIKKFFSDLKTVAFTGSYSDLTGAPTIAASVATLTAAQFNAASFTHDTYVVITDSDTIALSSSLFSRISAGVVVNMLTNGDVIIGTGAIAPAGSYNSPDDGYRELSILSIGDNRAVVTVSEQILTEL